MRQEEFTMERNILEVGQTVEITEGKLPRAYYYTAEPAAAMSKNIEFTRRILQRTGKVVKKEKDGASYIVTIEFDEE